jgi:hypothetical protein
VGEQDLALGEPAHGSGHLLRRQADQRRRLIVVGRHRDDRPLPGDLAGLARCGQYPHVDPSAGADVPSGVGRDGDHPQIRP